MLNIGVGDDLTILELAMLIQDVVGGEVELEFDTTKPNGTPRKDYADRKASSQFAEFPGPSRTTRWSRLDRIESSFPIPGSGSLQAGAGSRLHLH